MEIKMAFKLEDIKLEGNFSRQEIRGSYDFSEKLGLSGDRTFCITNCPCQEEGQGCYGHTPTCYTNCPCQENNSDYCPGHD